MEVAHDSGGDAPDVPLAERHRVVFPDAALPFAHVKLVVVRVHEEGERHLEGVGDFGAG